MQSRFMVPFQSPLSQALGEPFFDLHREMNRLLDDFAGAGAARAGQPSPRQQQGALMSAPRLDIREGEKEICLCAELPGVKPAELDLRIEGNVITLRGEKKNEVDEERENYHLMERSFGRFQRSIQLPFAPNPDQVRADFEHGVLSVHVPKPVEQDRSRRIEIQGGASGEPQGRVGGTQTASIGQSEAGAREEATDVTHH